MNVGVADEQIDKYNLLLLFQLNYYKIQENG